ncbi:MAG: SapC family protein [Pseudomonadota bacterium]
MTRRRAVSPEDQPKDGAQLPLFYKTMVPLSPEHHGALHLRPERDAGFAASANAIPLIADEFPRAMRDYPIVIAAGDVPTPAALVGFEPGKNDHVGADGAWEAGKYIPAYVRRYPFAFLKESADSDRHILCADVSSTQFSETAGDGSPLFTDRAKTETVDRVLDFCKRYATAAERTKRMMTEAQDLGLIGPSSVTITRGEARRKVEGFSVISEEKLRDLDDATLADLARRGVLTLFSAHHISLANFSAFGDEG